MIYVRSYCASKETFQADNYSLMSQFWVLVGQHLAFTQICMMSAVLRLDCLKLVYRDTPPTSATAATSFGFKNTRTAVQPVPCAHATVLAIRKKVPTWRASNFSPTTRFSRVPPVEVSLWLISYRKMYPTPAHRATSGQTINIHSAPSRLPGRTRVREPQIAQKHHEALFLDPQTRNKPRTSRVMRSCRSFAMVRWRRDLVVPRIGSL